MDAWAPPRRLRHVLAIKARWLDMPPGYRAFFTLAVPREGASVAERDGEGRVGEQWQVIYRSEKGLRDAVNPSWMPLDVNAMDDRLFGERSILLADTIRVCVYGVPDWSPNVDVSWHLPCCFVGRNGSDNEIIQSITGKVLKVKKCIETLKSEPGQALPSVSQPEPSADICPLLLGVYVIHLSKLTILKWNDWQSLSSLPANSLILEFTNGKCGTVTTTEVGPGGGAHEHAEGVKGEIPVKKSESAQELVPELDDELLESTANGRSLDTHSVLESSQTVKGSRSSADKESNSTLREENLSSSNRVDDTNFNAERVRDDGDDQRGTDCNSAGNEAGASSGLNHREHTPGAALISSEPQSYSHLQSQTQSFSDEGSEINLSVDTSREAILKDTTLGSESICPNKSNNAGEEMVFRHQHENIIPDAKLDDSNLHGKLSLSQRVSLGAFRSQIESFVSMRLRISALQDEANARRWRLEQRLAARIPAQNQTQDLMRYSDKITELSQSRLRTQKRLEEIVRIIEAQRQKAIVAAQALISTLQALLSANRRIKEAVSNLAGVHGRGRLSSAIQGLVSRRCLVVLQTAGVYQLGPTSVKVVKPPPGGLLDTHISVQWSGAPCPEDLSGLRINREKLETYGIVDDGRSGRKASAGGVRTQQVQRSDSALYQHEVRLTIGGFELNPSTWTDAFDPHGRSWDAVEDRIASIVLGYIAHVVDRCSLYLGVPLRYPIKFFGSHSLVLDNRPPGGEWNIRVSSFDVADGASKADVSMAGMNEGTTRAAVRRLRTARRDQDEDIFLFEGTKFDEIRNRNTYNDNDAHQMTSQEFEKRRRDKVVERSKEAKVEGSSRQAADASPPAEYPLYCESNRDRPNFAIAVFLLNKNVLQLLQAHGISASGPNELLENLYKLVAAAQSGIPPHMMLEF